jgi:hypothetical protein
MFARRHRRYTSCEARQQIWANYLMMDTRVSTTSVQKHNMHHVPTQVVFLSMRKEILTGAVKGMQVLSDVTQYQNCMRPFHFLRI